MGELFQSNGSNGSEFFSVGGNCSTEWYSTMLESDFSGTSFSLKPILKNKASPRTESEAVQKSTPVISGRACHLSSSVCPSGGPYSSSRLLVATRPASTILKKTLYDLLVIPKWTGLFSRARRTCHFYLSPTHICKTWGYFGRNISKATSGCGYFLECDSPSGILFPFLI